MQQTFSQPDDRGLWRFGIISPLLHRGDDCPPLHSQIEKLSLQVFYAPDGRELRLCPATLRTWLARYQQCGIDGLRNKPRKDHGTTSVTEVIADAVFIDQGDFLHLFALLFHLVQEVKEGDRILRVRGCDPEEIFQTTLGQGCGGGLGADEWDF